MYFFSVFPLTIRGCFFLLAALTHRLRRCAAMRHQSFTRKYVLDVPFFLLLLLLNIFVDKIPSRELNSSDFTSKAFLCLAIAELHRISEHNTILQCVRTEPLIVYYGPGVGPRDNLVDLIGASSSPYYVIPGSPLPHTCLTKNAQGHPWAVNLVTQKNICDGKEGQHQLSNSTTSAETPESFKNSKRSSIKLW